MAEFCFEVGGEQFRLQLDVCDGGYRSSIDGRAYHVNGRLRPDGRLDLLVAPVSSINSNGQRLRIYHARSSLQPNQRVLWLDGQTWVVTPVDARIQRTGQLPQPTEGAVNATAPGQVRAILVAVGDEVAVGDPLLVLETMKMEMRILTPSAGKIRKLYCALGDVVSRGQLLVEIGE